MAEDFLGLTVNVLLNDGYSLAGVVSHIDPHTQLLTLKNVLLQIPNLPPQHFPAYGISGTDIKDLQILSDQPAAEIRTSQQSPPPPSPVAVTIAPPPPTVLMSSSKVNLFSPPNVTSTGSKKYTIPPPTTALSSSMNPENPQQRVPLSDPAIVSFAPPKRPTSASSLPTCSDTTQSSLPTPAASISPAIKSTILDFDKLNIKSNNRRSTHLLALDNLVNTETADSSAAESGNDVNTRTSRRRGKQDKNQHNSHFNENHNGHGSPTTSPAIRPKTRKLPAHHEWATEAVDTFKSEEFDFQRNLELFDKAKVFAEIRENDSGNPDHLLVNLNRIRKDASSPLAPSPKINLSPREMVLERGNDTSEEEEGEIESNDSWTSGDVSNGHGANGLAPPTPPQKKVRIATASGVRVPVVTQLQMVEVEKRAALECALSEEALIENAGRGCAAVAIQVLGGARRIQPGNHNAAPLVVVLAGNNRTGAYGLCAARHLLNRGIQVVVTVIGKESEWVRVAGLIKAVTISGGKVVRSVVELPKHEVQPVDLIIDALLGYQYTLRDLPDDESNRKLVLGAMGWANANKAPVLSLDFPSGVNAGTGFPTHSTFIHPKWTLCLGAPKTGCCSRNVTGELLLADLGIPRVLWSRAGVKGWGSGRGIWGAEFFVGLEYL